METRQKNLVNFFNIRGFLCKSYLFMQVSYTPAPKELDCGSISKQPQIYLRESTVQFIFPVSKTRVTCNHGTPKRVCLYKSNSV